MHELVGESIVSVYENLEAARETNRQLYKNGGTIHDHESRVKTKSGKIIPVRISASHLKDSSGNYIGAVGYFERYRPWPVAEAKVKAYAEELECKLDELRGSCAPVFELYPGISAVVVVGCLDVGRLEPITKNLLSHLQTVKTRVVLIDLSAASIADDNVAGQLIKTMHTIHLLGTQCMLVGIQLPLAQAMESLVADVSSVKSFGSMDVALDAAFNTIGLEICKKS